MRLPAGTRAELQRAFEDALETPQRLNLVLSDALGLRPADVFTAGGIQPDHIRELIARAEADDMVPELVVAARQRNPTNQQLIQFVLNHFSDLIAIADAR